MYLLHTVFFFLNNDILSQNVTILHVVCVREMLNFLKKCVNMKHESPSENKLHLTFDIRRFETTSFFKQNIRTLDDF